MYISKHWGKWKQSHLTITHKRTEFDFLLHPKEWTTPFISLSFGRGFFLF